MGGQVQRLWFCDYGEARGSDLRRQRIEQLQTWYGTIQALSISFVN